MDTQTIRRSPNVKGTSLFRELDETLIYQIYEHMDYLWNVTAFIPCPINSIAREFNITPTHVTYVLMAWRESRMKEYIYNKSILPETTLNN